MSALAINRLVQVLIAVVVGVGIALGARYFMTNEQLVPVTIGGPFTLTDQNGQRRSDADFRGKLMLVTFGYTSCPDVCPLDMQLMADALDKLGPQAEAIQPVFVTVDPKRDTVDVVKDYVAHFSPRFVGLTGSDADVAAAAKAYRVYYKLHEPGKDGNYNVDHSAFIFLMARDGTFLTHFNPDTPVERMAETLRKYL
jgi:cytochrome oxidase Cu insertion factor (SCO1/SenC/PrrC family)